VTSGDLERPLKDISAIANLLMANIYTCLYISRLLSHLSWWVSVYKGEEYYVIFDFRSDICVCRHCQLAGLSSVVC